MSKLKKYLGIAMAALMAFALAPASALAAQEKGSITVDNAVAGQEYAIYKVLDLESYNAEANAYSYTAAEGWLPFLEGQSDVVKIENGYVSWIGAAEDDSDQIAAFAAAALAFAKDNGIDPVKTVEAAGTTVSFDDLDLGYYLLDSTLGTLCSLDTNAPTVTIKEKNPEPTVTKEVQEDSTGAWSDENDATIGDEVNYRSTISVNKEGASRIVYHDTMSAGLTFDSTKVKVTMENGDEVAAENWSLIEDSTDGCTFEVAFTEEFCNGLTAADKIVITYSATLNENAVVAGAGNPNDAWLSYGENNGTTTEKDTTVTYTWAVNVFKYTGDDQPLAGATFALTDTAGNPINLVAVEGAADTYRVTTGTGSNSITTSDSGKFRIEGLDAGAYWLTETAAPAGYNMLAAPVEFTIGAEGALTPAVDVDGVPTIKVQNNTGLQLPSTGGIGTTLFYIGGAVLIIGAVAFLITRRRANSAK